MCQLPAIFWKLQLIWYWKYAKDIIALWFRKHSRDFLNFWAIVLTSL